MILFISRVLCFCCLVFERALSRFCASSGSKIVFMIVYHYPPMSSNIIKYFFFGDYCNHQILFCNRFFTCFYCYRIYSAVLLHTRDYHKFGIMIWNLPAGLIDLVILLIIN
jgi:hypothetical protein